MSLLDILTDGPHRDDALEVWAAGRPLPELRAEIATLDAFRTTTTSLYARVRALLFLSNLEQYFVLPQATGAALASYSAVEQIRNRHFERAIGELRAAVAQHGESPALSSTLAAAYRGLAFQTLAEQVRRSVRNFPGNQWMFRTGHWLDYPLRLRPELLTGPPFPVLAEQTPVRMDLTHSAWSDIFFLAMDYPEGARVINISVDLALSGHPGGPRPPIETFCRVIDEPVLRLVSVDLEARADIHTIDEVFDYGADYLGLVKAAVIASGIVPPGFEGSRQRLTALLERLTGRPGLGLEVASQVNEIPKGSRLAVSTNLLASLIAVLMRATGQIANLTGELTEADRRQVAARAILGEWLGGSGGGWQDSGGIWPGIKLIAGVPAPAGADSRGELLPRHQVLSNEMPAIEDSLVVVHGGMSQDVGPILEMCTERYLLRTPAAWQGRAEAQRLFGELLAALQSGDAQRLGQLTQANFDGPIQTIIPWANNAYTAALIEACRQRFGAQFWGFWMLGGMSGGGMGFVFDPKIRNEAKLAMRDILRATKQRFAAAIPFAIDPVVYDFRINPRGSVASLRTGDAAVLSEKYALFLAPAWLRQPPASLPTERRTELARIAATYPNLTAPLIERLFPKEEMPTTGAHDLDGLLHQLGFDPEAHARLRADYLAGRIGLARNILPADLTLSDASPTDVQPWRHELTGVGQDALASGRAGVFTLAGGVGSRWTKGAGTVKALIPFHRFGAKYFNFLDVHLAKTARLADQFGRPVPHLVSTSYLTGAPIAAYLRDTPAIPSPGRSIGLRLLPTLSDLRYLWEVLPQQQLDEQKQKVRASGRAGLMRWVESMGEASDYRDNLPAQCIHPVGHWYEFPNLLLNGVLRDLLAQQPQLEVLLMHNVDTLGATLDASLLGLHLSSGAAITVEVVRKQFGDHGGSLARVNGRPRLVEGLALPSEEVELGLSFYNSGTYWLTIDKVLAAFGLTRAQLIDSAAVEAAVRRTARRVPSYITIKDVKKRWGRGQENIYPVAQFERLWGDMTALDDLHCQYVEVPRRRGQQLKEVAQLDTWLRDGSAADIARLLGL